MLAIVFLAAPLLAAPARIINANLQSVPSLAQAPSTGWIGYAVTLNRTFTTCGCHLGSSSENMSDVSREPSAGVLFARFDDGHVARVRLFSTCEIDADHQTVTWVENVSPSESIAFLRRAIEDGTNSGRESALFALAMHEGGIDPLIEIARHDASGHLRGQALFWLSQAAGEKAAAALRDAVDNDPEESVRAKAVFGISQLPNDQSIPMLIDLLEHNRSREVRKKAAFWLGQKNDPRALDAIAAILQQ